jgi:hypothetical protein
MQQGNDVTAKLQHALVRKAIVVLCQLLMDYEDVPRPSQTMFNDKCAATKTHLKGNSFEGFFFFTVRLFKQWRTIK